MRAGELYGLRVEDVDFEHGVVLVRRSVWNGREQTPKTRNARRAVDVQPYVLDLLGEHLRGRAIGFLFLNRLGGPLRNTTVLHSHLHPLLKRLGIPVGGMHAFRHFRVSFLIQNATPVELVKRWIGHGSEEMIRRYTHLHPTYCKKVLAQVPCVGEFAHIDPEQGQLAVN